jgi:hypothetical protein
VACMTKADRDGLPDFLPEVVIHTVKMACELPDQHGCSLSQWDCQRLADQLVKEGIVSSISRKTVRRILADHRLKPWRYHLWLSPKVPRDAAFIQTVQVLVALYTRELEEWEIVLCVDEKTSLQPRPRLAVTLESKITRIYIVLDNVKMHKGQQVRAWLADHPRFIFQRPPVHCSWINQVEQWFSILQRKRFGIVNFKNLSELVERIEAFVKEWNEKAHPFKWTRESGAKLIARYEQKIVVAAGATKGGNLKMNEKGSQYQKLKDYTLQPVISLSQGINIRQSGGSWQYGFGRLISIPYL